MPTAEPRHAGADVRQVEQFEQTLNGSVLAERTVQQGHHDDGSGGTRRLEHRGGGNLATDGIESGGKFVGSTIERRHGCFGEVPTSTAIDSDGEDVVAVAVDGPQNVSGGDAADVVLGGLPPEDDDQRRARGARSRIVHVPNIQVGRGWGVSTTIDLVCPPNATSPTMPVS